MSWFRRSERCAAEQLEKMTRRYIDWLVIDAVFNACEQFNIDTLILIIIIVIRQHNIVFTSTKSLDAHVAHLLFSRWFSRVQRKHFPTLMAPGLVELKKNDNWSLFSEIEEIWRIIKNTRCLFPRMTQSSIFTTRSPPPPFHSSNAQFPLLPLRSTAQWY